MCGFLRNLDFAAGSEEGHLLPVKSKALVTIALIGASATAVLAQPPVAASSKKYTVNADFNLGSVVNLNMTPADQLQLNTVASSFPVMWIANAGEDSVSKIDTVNKKELARYKTWINFASACTSDHCGNAYAGAAPSRTAVDTDGNVYVVNRHFDGRSVTVMKILSSTFIDRNGNGTEQTSKDTNNDGVIQYSEMLTNTDANFNGILDPTEIADERVAWFITIPNTQNFLGRSLALDNAGNLYVGMYNASSYFKVRGTDGALLGGPFPTPGHTPYGGAIDGNGNLWGASLSNNLLKFNTATNTTTSVLAHPGGSDYGIAIGNNAGVLHVYQASLGGNSYIDFNTVTNAFSLPAAISFYAIGAATDGSGNIFLCNGSTGGIASFTPAGALRWNAPAQPGHTCYGVVVDSDQNAWGVGHYSNNIAKYRGTDGAALGTHPVGQQPYTYSDATGIARFAAQRVGTFTVIQDSGLAANVWKSISFNTEAQGAVPPNTTLAVEARFAASQAGLAGAAFQPITSGASLCAAGRFAEVRSTLQSTDAVATPVLSDVAIAGKCDVNGDGAVNQTDISLINAARNTPATGACDMRDADGNLTINVNDSRQCVLKCNKPNCAI